MNAPTAQQLLRQLATTRETDQRTRLDNLLRWSLLIGAAGMLPALVVGLAVAR